VRERALAGGGFGGVNTTVAAFAFLEVEEGFEEVGSIEIRPQRFGDEDFRVGNLPEKKIADAHFTAGADEEIGIGKVGSVEMARDLFLGDGLTMVVGLGEDGIHGVHNFSAAAVV